MRNIFLIIVAGVVFIGCASDNQNLRKQTYEETITKEKDSLFKQNCSKQGGILDTKYSTIGLYYCQIGESKIQNNTEGYAALSDFFDEEGYSKNGFNINGLHKDTLTKYDKNGYDKNGFNQNGYDKNGKNKDGLTQQEQMQKEYNNKMLAFEKEKLELERQRLAILKQQAEAEDISRFNRTMESLSRQQQNLSNEYSKIIQQNLNNSQNSNTYYITPMGNGFYNVKQK